MRIRATYVVCACLLCLAFVAGTATAQQEVFPTVTLQYDSNASSYTYHVSLASNNSYPFGQLLIFTTATSWNGFEETWSQRGAIVGGVDQNWLCGFSPAGAVDTAEWRSSGDQEAFSNWEGDFVLIAPGTVPVPGMGQTKDGVVESSHYFDIMVPGVVPEPSSLLALGGLIGLAAPVIRRRRS